MKIEMKIKLVSLTFLITAIIFFSMAFVQRKFGDVALMGFCVIEIALTLLIGSYMNLISMRSKNKKKGDK